MKVYKKGDSEYISNGYYSIDEVKYMSIWSYKKKNNIIPNTSSVNGDDGIELFNLGISSYESKPDFGNYGKILLYPLNELEEFYSN